MGRIGGRLRTWSRGDVARRGGGVRKCAGALAWTARPIGLDQRASLGELGRGESLGARAVASQWSSFCRRAHDALQPRRCGIGPQRRPFRCCSSSTRDLASRDGATTGYAGPWLSAPDPLSATEHGLSDPPAVAAKGRDKLPGYSVPPPASAAPQSTTPSGLDSEGARLEAHLGRFAPRRATEAFAPSPSLLDPSPRRPRRGSPRRPSAQSRLDQVN